jgi:phenylpropionate dioxygenase-like ring-hydroxylating dioxygenase large terminal subunit
MIARNAWYLAAWSQEIGARPLARRICNEPVVLFRSLQGDAVALIDSCAHRGAPLSLGTVVANGIRCNYHGVVYGCSGHCVEIPNQDIIPPQAKVKRFPLIEKNQMCWIWIGNAEPDAHLLVDYPFHGDPACGRQVQPRPQSLAAEFFSRCGARGRSKPWGGSGPWRRGRPGR